MTTFKLYTVYAFYTVKIYKNNPPKIVKGGGGAPALDPPFLLIICIVKVLVCKFKTSFQTSSVSTRFTAKKQFKM